MELKSGKAKKLRDQHLSGKVRYAKKIGKIQYKFQ